MPTASKRQVSVSIAAIKTRRSAWVLLAVSLLAAPALAEKADRDKPVNIESDRMNADDARKTATFEGRVVLTQGTMAIRAERIVVRQDNDGFQSGTAIGAAGGNLATFRQKREGVNEYIDAEAERIEYDGRTDRIEFFNRAKLHRGEGDDVCGNFISYDSRTEVFTVNAGKSAAGAPAGRVRAIIIPRGANAPGEAKPAAKPPTPCPS